MNLVVLTGRLTRDVELKFGQSGSAYARLSLAVDRPVGKGKEKETDFINCVAFGKTAEMLGEYVKKGSKIAVNGRLQIDLYEKDGEKKSSANVMIDRVEFLDSKGSSEGKKANSKSNTVDEEESCPF